MEISGKCVESTVMAIVISIAAVILVSILGMCYIRWRNKKNDEIWQINVDELMLDVSVDRLASGTTRRLAQLFANTPTLPQPYRTPSK